MNGSVNPAVPFLNLSKFVPESQGNLFRESSGSVLESAEIGSGIPGNWFCESRFWFRESLKKFRESEAQKFREAAKSSLKKVP